MGKSVEAIFGWTITAEPALHYSLTDSLTDRLSEVTPLVGPPSVGVYPLAFALSK